MALSRRCFTLVVPSQRHFVVQRFSWCCTSPNVESMWRPLVHGATRGIGRGTVDMSVRVSGDCPAVGHFELGAGLGLPARIRTNFQLFRSCCGVIRLLRSRKVNRRYPAAEWH